MQLRACALAACLLIASTLAACGNAPEQVAGADEWRHVAVSLETDGQVAIVDPAAGTVVARIPVGKRPRGIKTSPDGRLLYVALSGSPISPPGVDESTLPPPDRAADGIGVVDLASRTLLKTLQSGQDPETFGVSPDGTRLFVSNEETAEMTAIDLTTGAVLGVVKVGGEPEGVAVRPDGKVVYVTCEATSEVVAVDAEKLSVIAHMPTGGRPRSIVFTPDGATAYVTAELGQSIAVIDAQDHVVIRSIPITAPAGAPQPLPMDLALDPELHRLYVSNGRGRSIAVVDTQRGSQVAAFTDVGARPWGIALSADRRFLYTANGPSNDMSVVDPLTGEVLRRVQVGARPWGVAVVRQETGNTE